MIFKSPAWRDSCLPHAAQLDTLPLSYRLSPGAEPQMELIRQIRQAEAEAQQLIEKGKADAAALAEQSRQRRRQRLEEAEQQRKKAIESAVARARDQALADAQNLKTKAEQQRRQLRDSVSGKIPSAVAKVVGFLKG